MRTSSMNCSCTWIYWAKLCSSCMKLEIYHLNQQDKVKWKDLDSELEKEFVCLYNNYFTQCTLTCKLPLLTVDTKRPGRRASHIPKDVVVKLRGLNFSLCTILDMFGVSRWTVMCRVQEYGLSDL